MVIYFEDYFALPGSPSWDSPWLCLWGQLWVLYTVDDCVLQVSNHSFILFDLINV